MFYRPEDGHGLPHNPFNALIVPRPIGWISTRDSAGRDNLAPYSFFNGVAYTPPQVMFSTTGPKPDRDGMKDSASVIVETGVFCVNVVSQALTDAMNTSSQGFDAGVDEFEKAGLAKADCETIDCARVAAAPAAMECKLTQVVKLPGQANTVIFGEVTGIYIDETCMTDGKLDITKYHPLARLGYRDYAVIEKGFTLSRPDD
ncbi:MAG: flavin reductase family protein [Paracoccaceae bacterium]|jgi:flavin reductase (DIM6/NTAB) family NADH-FMN oxidoreductase RutF|nr:flavin reductase family protein [Paracoccaceae bacterium]MDP7186774.1 flavin reductase family protein [Paracoccaceae bacterium]